jgi:cytochrome c oxidase subunit 2
MTLLTGDFMKLKNWVATGAATILSMALALSTHAAGDPAKGRALYATCASCHGANGEGNQALNAPAIAGQQDWYLTRQLKNYQDGIRGTHPKDIYGMQMRPMSMVVWGETKTADIVAYITSLPDPENAAVTLGGDPTVGQANYMVCAACHGANGEGNQALNAPRIAGQFDWYTHRQLMNWKNGVRGTHPKDTYGMQMIGMAATLVDETAVKNISAYIANLGK